MYLIQTENLFIDYGWWCSQLRKKVVHLLILFNKYKRYSKKIKKALVPRTWHAKIEHKKKYNAKYVADHKFSFLFDHLSKILIFSFVKYFVSDAFSFVRDKYFKVYCNKLNRTG